MRYHTAVYITRADHWSFEYRERVPITEPEWLAYVSGDSECQRVTSMRAWNPVTGHTFEVPVEGYWEWMPYSRRGIQPAFFQYDRGGIIVRAPDPEVLWKAEAVAASLGARVLSDELP